MGSILNYILPTPSRDTQQGPVSNYIISHFKYTLNSEILEGYRNVLVIETTGGYDSLENIFTDEFVSHVLENDLTICACVVADPGSEPSFKKINTFTKLNKIYDRISYIDSNVLFEVYENVSTFHYFLEEAYDSKQNFYGTDNDLGYVSVRPTENQLDSYRNKKFLSFSRNNDKRHRLSLLHDYLTNDFSDSYFSFLQNIDSQNNCKIYHGDDTMLTSDKYNEKIPIELDTKGIINGFRTDNTLPTHLFLDSIIHIVSETSFECNELFISEKVLKPILNYQPFVVIGPHNYLKELKKQGYKTFNEFWDESYDEIKDPAKRYMRVRELILDLNKKSIEELNLLYKNLKHICIYNNKQFHSMESNNSLRKILTKL